MGSRGSATLRVAAEATGIGALVGLLVGTLAAGLGAMGMSDPGEADALDLDAVIALPVLGTVVGFVVSHFRVVVHAFDRLRPVWLGWVGAPAALVLAVNLTSIAIDPLVVLTLMVGLVAAAFSVLSTGEWLLEHRTAITRRTAVAMTTRHAGRPARN